MAVILKLGKKYQITYEVVTPTKEIKSIKEIFDNYEDAAKRKELLDGEVCMFSPESLFVDVMEDWLADPYFRDHLKKYHEAQKNYDVYLRNMIQTKKVKEVDSNLANSIINQLCATKSIGRNSALSVKTIRACKLLLISTCDHAIKMGIMDENPFNEIHISDPHDFKKRPKKYADWRYETMIQIFDACKEEKLYVIMQIVFATGMNVTDVLGLVWSDFYHEKDKYYIRTNKVMERMYEKELQFLPKDYVIQKYVHDKKIKLKTQVVHHYVDKENIYSIPCALYELLQNWKKRSKEIYHFDINPNSLMFTTYGINPYDDRLVLKHLDQTTLNLKLPRHTLAGLKFFSSKTSPDGRHYRDIYYYEHNDISFNQIGLTAKEKAVKINKEFTKSMKKELPDKDKKDAVDLVKQLSEDKNIRKKLLMKLLEIESGE